MNVVPTKATAKLARHMVAEAIKQESGAEAVIIHYDDVDPEQIPALVGLLLDAGIGNAITAAAAERAARPARPCAECGETWHQLKKGKCYRCYEAARRLAAGAKPHGSTPLTRECAACGEVKRIAAKGKCSPCYKRSRVPSSKTEVSAA